MVVFMDQTSEREGVTKIDDGFWYNDEPLLPEGFDLRNLDRELFRAIVGKMIEFEDTYGSPFGEPEHYRIFGFILFCMGDYDTAFRFWLIAVKLFEEENDLKGRDRVYRMMATPMMMPGNGDHYTPRYGMKALDCVLQALEAKEKRVILQ